MTQFRKKPVVIEAYQFLKDGEVNTASRPDWVAEALRSDTITLTTDDGWYVQTLESGTLAPQHKISDEDWIIRGVQGELYPCKPEIFAATYDACEQPRPGNASEQAIETEIQAKGLTAPRLTPADIDGTIASIAYHRFPGTTLTICCVTLRNGFNVTGESAAASPENFNEHIGNKIAFENARQKIWALEGYLLRERLAAAA
jgi:hypothetical protein